jgi:DNA primase
VTLQAFKEEVLNRIQIVDVVSRFVSIKKAGIHHKGLCPFHGEKTPSFTVSPSRQTYHCFGCGAHGNAIDFLMAISGRGFLEILEELGHDVGLNLPPLSPESASSRFRSKEEKETKKLLHQVLEEASGHYRKALKNHPQALAYLNKRGLNPDVVARFGLGYAPGGWRFLSTVMPDYASPLLVHSGMVIAPDADEDPATPSSAAPASPTEAKSLQTKRYDRFRDRIMFPIRLTTGEVIGFGGRVLDAGEPKYLNSPETPIFSKGRELYGLHEARTSIQKLGRVLVVEGYMDVVALAQHGISHAVATLGTACTAEHLHKLFRFANQVVFAFDGDKAGRKAAIRAMETALPAAKDERILKFLFLPPEHDPDSFVRSSGADAFLKAEEMAMPLSRMLIEHSVQGANLTGPEARAQMLKRAGDLWQLLPEQGNLRRLMLGEWAKLGQIDATDLARSWGMGEKNSPDRPGHNHENGGPDPHKPSFNKSGRGSQREKTSRTSRYLGGQGRTWPVTNADQVLRFLLNHPGLLNELERSDYDLLDTLPEPHASILVWLEQDCMTHGTVPWAVIEARLSSGHPELWQHTKPIMYFEEQLRQADPEPEKGLRTLLNRIKAEDLKKMKNEIAEAGLLRPLTTEETRRLLDLGEQLKALYT